jgi:hypothetical protein
MYAFGDLMRFLAVFAMVSPVPTARFGDWDVSVPGFILGKLR